ncbi:MAG TPA: hypothetical protein VIK27_07600 [Candidatus Aquilonibacter sp.]
MHLREKRFGDVTMTFIETDEGDSPRVTRAEYELLREHARSLQAQDVPPNVVLSLPTFERMLQEIAVGLQHEGRE